MDYKVIAVHRQKALDKGFQGEDFSTWIAILSQWLYSIGAKSCSFSSEQGTDNIVIYTKFDPEPDNVLLADIVMQDGIKTVGPLRLENYEPYTMGPVLMAWRHIGRSFVDRDNAVSKLLQGFVDQIEGAITGRKYYPPEAVERIIDVTLKFPYSKDEVDQEREECAKLAMLGFWAPTDSAGCCLECGNWTPARHPERHEHEPSCKTGKREFVGDATIAEKIRLRGLS